MFRFFKRGKSFDNKQTSIIVGSSPLATKLKKYDLDNFYKIAINNSWRVRDDFDYAVYPDDFPKENMPSKGVNFFGKEIVQPDYMRSIDKAGGILYAGATMAYATGYWAVDNMTTPLIGYYASDMVYNLDTKQTHFYGNGTPDPLRQDVSLGSLEARSIRLFAWALNNNKLLVNFSDLPQSRLKLPRVSLVDYKNIIPPQHIKLKKIWSDFIKLSKDIQKIEKKAKFDSLNWTYWELIKTEEDRRYMERLDALWSSLEDSLNSGFKSYIELISK